jgi:serine protease AprX
MKHVYRFSSLILLFALVAMPVLGQAKIGQSLQNVLGSLTDTAPAEVIVTFHGDGPLGPVELGIVESLGITQGLYLSSLPIIGVLATRSQINALAQRSEVRSIWLNERLQYENDGSTSLTGVDRLRTDSSLRTAQGLPYSGKGIGVVINDSGVDGTHSDHLFPERVVQNVAAQTNLRAVSGLLPYTATENVPDTDIAGGHGTHVAGIIGGSGRQSGGKYEGVAPGASLIGYGSGAGLFILDTVGGFDWALTNQFAYNIRVISNSFGSTTDLGTDFDPNHPTNVATKALADRGIVVVFSAGNSGPGENTITGNFKKAPWVITVAAGDKHARLASFSSRGRENHGGTVTINGRTYEWVDRPHVTAPGVDVISTKARTSSLAALSALDDAEYIDPAYLPYYTTMSGTSMACPHVSGIVALMLEANPQLDVYQVRDILQSTASNMPARTSWEAGAGYVNAYAAVVAALGLRTDFGATVNAFRTFHSNVILDETRADFDLAFDPLGLNSKTYTFEVNEDLAQIAAYARVAGALEETGNLLGLRLVAPDGSVHSSGIPVLFTLTVGRDVVVDNPMQGTWTVELYGLNGLALPEETTGHVRLKSPGRVEGLDDIAGHEVEGSILAAVSGRLIDGFNDRRFRPDRKIRRSDLAEFLVMGTGIRQHLPASGHTFSDVAADLRPFAEAVVAQGAALKDRGHRHSGVMRHDGSFRPNGSVSRVDLAYSLVQSLGLESQARAYSGTVRVEYGGQHVAIADADKIPADLRGYVQLALDLNLLNAYFELEQGRFDLTPTMKAYFRPSQDVTRADYAVAATRFLDQFGRTDLDLSSTSSEGGIAGLNLLQKAEENHPQETPLSFALDQNYPNPFNPTTTIRFTLPQTAQVRLTVYDVTGREVARLVEGTLEAGTHTASWEAMNAASGLYLYRIDAGSFTSTRQMMLVK